MSTSKNPELSTQDKMRLARERCQKRSDNRKQIRDEIQELSGGTPYDFINERRKKDPKFIASNKKILELLKTT